jgi:hypothetical protein
MSLYPTVPAAVAGTIDTQGRASGIFEKTYISPDGGRKTVLTFVNSSHALADDAGIKAWMGPKILTLADGLVTYKGAVIDLTALSSTYPAVTGLVAAWDGDVALGSSGAINAGDASPDGTEVDLIALTSTTQAVAGLATVKGISTTTEAPKTKDGTATAFDIYLTIVVDDGDQDVTTTPTNLVLNGTIVIDWHYHGDN